MTEEITWDEATKTDSKFVKFEQDEPKILVMKNWKLVEVDKFGAKKIELQADVIEEDGEACEKVFENSSVRLKKKLRPILEEADSTKPVKVSIIMVGEKYKTEYSCKEVKE